MHIDGGFDKEKEFLQSEPQQEPTRKQRRSLLAASTLGIVLAIVGVVPSEMSVFGVKFLLQNPELLPALPIVINGYFIVAFFVYASRDFRAWKKDSYRELAEWARYQREEEMKEEPADTWEHYVPGTARWKEANKALGSKHPLRRAHRFYWFRTIVDFYGPLVLSGSNSVPDPQERRRHCWASQQCHPVVVLARKASLNVRPYLGNGALGLRSPVYRPSGCLSTIVPSRDSIVPWQ